jgi:hypothetical protein
MRRMPRIRSLRPNVNREDALAYFSSRGPLESLRNTFFGPLRSVADLYIPFRLFRVEITNRGVMQTEFFGLESVLGTMDLFRFEELPETIVIETRNAVEPRLDEAQAAALVISKVRRLLYSRGFFRMRGLRLGSTALPGDVYVPYWIGFRGHRQNASFRVVDAVRRRPEGGKVRQIVLNWLLTPGSQPASSP